MRNENDIRNPQKKYTAQELDTVVTATVKDNGFQVIGTFGNKDTPAYTLYTKGNRFIAVFSTTNDRTPQATSNGEIIDKTVTGKFTLDVALQFYKKSIKASKSEKDFELIIPLCLTPNDPTDPKHLVYLKIYKDNKKMHAEIYDSTNQAHWSLPNILPILLENFPGIKLAEPISLNGERSSSLGVNDGPFTAENIAMDIEAKEMIDQSHSGKTAQQLREEQYATVQKYNRAITLEELAQTRSQLKSTTKPEEPNLNIVSEEESVAQLQKATLALQSTIKELELWEKETDNLPQIPSPHLAQHRKSPQQKGHIRNQELSRTIDINTQIAYLSQLKVIKNMLGTWNENDKNTMEYNITLEVLDPKKKILITQDKIIKVPPVIAAILDKIKSANTSNAEQILKEIRNIADADTKDTKFNRWKSSSETKKTCARLVDIIDKYPSPQARPSSPEHKA